MPATPSSSPRNLVVCCDGTSNEPGPDITNVLKLFRILRKSERQLVFYDPGVGTLSLPDPWSRLHQKLLELLGLATGYGLDANVVRAYRFICEHYRDGDRLFLFGFSRGAYTVRVLAGLIQLIGLLRPNQLNLADFAMKAYKRSSEDMPDGDAPPAPPSGQPSPAPAPDRGTRGLPIGWDVAEELSARPVPIHFMGVWDTVASVIIPLKAGGLGLQRLPYTRTNPSVITFRQAMAIDERRRMFRLNAWRDPQNHLADRFAKPRVWVPQDIKQVWFAGCHSDIGGGFPEIESGPAKYPLIWMVQEAVAAGAEINPQMLDHLGYGQPRPGGRHTYVPPSVSAPLHSQPAGAWWLLEYLPKSVRYREWPGRRAWLGSYLPLAEPRPIPEGALLHSSVIARMDLGYKPINLPTAYEVEP